MGCQVLESFRCCGKPRLQHEQSVSRHKASQHLSKVERVSTC